MWSVITTDLLWSAAVVAVTTTVAVASIRWAGRWLWTQVREEMDGTVRRIVREELDRRGE